MIEVLQLTFNPFQENTYLVWDETMQCVVFDPGCWNEQEKNHLAQIIEKKQLKPVRLINTHCHLDHVFGNRFVADRYGIGLEIHQGELALLQAFPRVCLQYGIPAGDEMPVPVRFIEEGEEILFGNAGKLKTLLTPGHSPASLCFYCEEHAFIIAGDVLFEGSIGRTDLPGGDYETLIHSIQSQLMPLDDNVKVYSGHGPSTTIGQERRQNPFLLDEE